MPRKRICIKPGDHVHTVFRTDNREFLFEAAQDQLLFIEALWRQKRRYQSKIFAWTGMSNHHHVLNEVPKQWHDETAFARRQNQLGVPFENGQMVRDTMSFFSKRFNRQHDREGGVVQDRTRSLPVTSQRHGLILLLYIFLNPVRAGIVNHPMDYPFNNFRQYALGEPGSFDGLFDLHPVYLQLGESSRERRKYFSELVELALGDWARKKWDGASATNSSGRNRAVKAYEEFLEYTQAWMEQLKLPRANLSIVGPVS